MSNAERQLIKAGAVLVSCNRHRVYELVGRRFTLHHSNRKADIDFWRVRKYINKVNGGK